MLNINQATVRSEQNHALTQRWHAVLNAYSVGQFESALAA